MHSKLKIPNTNKKNQIPYKCQFLISSFLVYDLIIKYKIKELTYPNEDDFLQQNYFYEIEVREGILGFKTVNRDLNVALPAEH